MRIEHTSRSTDGVPSPWTEGRTETDGLSRRAFLRLGALALTTPNLQACLESPAEPVIDHGQARLTATPGSPTLTATIGESELGLDPISGRDGLMYVPTGYDPDTPSPLLVALHGATRSVADWRGLFTDCEQRGLVLLAIDSRGGTWDRVRGRFGVDVPFIDGALAHTFDRVAIDPDRIALCGISDGASYTLSLGLNNGDLFNRLIAYSPGFSEPHPDFIVGQPDIWISHGRSDTILFESRTRNLIVPELRAGGYDVSYVDYDGGHEFPREIIVAGLDWLEDSW